MGCRKIENWTLAYGQSSYEKFQNPQSVDDFSWVTRDVSYATWSAGAHFQGQTNGRPVGTSWPPNTFGTCCGPQWPCQEAESWGQCQCSRAGCCTMMSSRLLSAGQQPYWQRRGTRTMEPLRLLEAAYRIRPLFPTPSGISRPSGYSGYTGHPLLNSFRRRMKTASPSPIMLFPKRYQWISGWWSGTCFFSYIGNNRPNWRNHILQRGRLKPPTR